MWLHICLYVCTNRMHGWMDGWALKGYIQKQCVNMVVVRTYAPCTHLIRKRGEVRSKQHPSYVCQEPTTHSITHKIFYIYQQKISIFISVTGWMSHLNPPQQNLSRANPLQQNSAIKNPLGKSPCGKMQSLPLYSYPTDDLRSIDLIEAAERVNPFHNFIIMSTCSKKRKKWRNEDSSIRALSSLNFMWFGEWCLSARKVSSSFPPSSPDFWLLLYCLHAKSRSTSEIAKILSFRLLLPSICVSYNL